MLERSVVPIAELMDVANMELILLDFKSSTLSWHSKEFRSFSHYCKENKIYAYNAETGSQYFQRRTRLHGAIYFDSQNPDHGISHPACTILTVKNLKYLLSMPDTSASKGRRHLVLLTVLYDTVVRVSELVDICMLDVQLNFPAVITLHGKGGKIRTVPLMKQTAELLCGYLSENHIDVRRNPDIPLFGNGSRRKLTRSGVTYIVQKYADMARETTSGMPAKISPHVFRYTKAMHIVQSNMNPVFIKNYLGHADISTTEVYGRADNKAKRAALEKATVHLDLPKASHWRQNSELIEWLSSLG